jgi:hypothetical protein
MDVRYEWFAVGVVAGRGAQLGRELRAGGSRRGPGRAGRALARRGRPRVRLSVGGLRPRRAASRSDGGRCAVGATHCGAFTLDAQLSEGCVAAWVSSAGASYGVCHVARDDRDIAGSARLAAETARRRAGEHHAHSVLIVISDGLTPDQREVARGVYEVTGATVPFVGGAAGDDLRWERTCTFGEGVLRSNGILAIWLNSAQPMGVSIDHGWRPISQPMLVTRAEGTVIYELDGQPALDVYTAELGGDVDPKAPDFIKQALEHPIGLPNAHNGYDVRQLHARLPGGGGIGFNTGMPEQTVVRIMSSDADSLIQGALRAASAAISRKGEPAVLALVFSCGSRVALLGDRVGDEVAAIAEGVEGAAVCGFFTFGEFGHVLGSTGVHNSSVVVLAL